eukprot:CAMPEP_0183360454 /NCGR_PEP_ID=MMETSP0164_2-20130417/55229_1 /TAXON_ID=221442 /ORGANISM="Coccolithus pelagicus ssp braarudi, Strain PLY182g" /LENGTH=185 /DNA_ID=CAMNT_0025534817 /DNA_START=85 /DNA_END=642 /DNA_ORIENTATION=-
MRLTILLLALCSCVVASPAVDSAHKYMEPPPSKAKRPVLRNPVTKPSRAGVGGLVASLLTTRRSAAFLPAALMALCFVQPKLMSRLLLHAIFCVGSLLEPFETVLPERSIIRSFVQTMQKARRAYEEKHGLAHIGEQQFFDDDVDAVQAEGAESPTESEGDSSVEDQDEPNAADNEAQERTQSAD